MGLPRHRRRTPPLRCWTACAALLALGLAAPPAAAGGLPHRLSFDRLSRAQGLSQVTILDGLQDRKGFLWFATQDGLNRFDGYEVVVFKHQPGDPASLSQSLIAGLFEDLDGMLWIATQQPGVLNRLDPRRERVERLLSRADDPATLPPSLIVPGTLSDDGQGALWAGTTADGLVSCPTNV